MYRPAVRRNGYVSKQLALRGKGGQEIALTPPQYHGKPFKNLSRLAEMIDAAKVLGFSADSKDIQDILSAAAEEESEAQALDRLIDNGQQALRALLPL